MEDHLNIVKLAELTVYRTPTVAGPYGALGRNRWVRAHSRGEAISICRDHWGVTPVEVFEAPGNKIEIWEKAPK